MRLLTEVPTRRPVGRRWLTATAALLVALTLPDSVVLLAAEEDTQVAVTGTDNGDVINVGADASATASVETSGSGTLKATATGVDALGGDDAIDTSGALATNASAIALLTENPGKTGAEALAIGISGGEGDDTVTSLSAFFSLANALGSYAGALEYQPAEGTPPPKALDFSISTAATAAGFRMGAGSDAVTNSGLLTITALGTSGGTADLLNTTVRESVNVRFTSTAGATATGIEAGAGGDTATNAGVMLNTATATAGALTVGLVAPQGTPPPDPQNPGTPPAPKKTQIDAAANATATATAVGIEGEEDETEDSAEETSPFGIDGLKVTYERTVSAVSGDDTLTNSVFLTNLATATSGAGAAAVSLKVDGTVKASATAEATAEGTGIAGSGGNDTVTNSGELLSAATATAGAVSVSLVTGAPSESGPVPTPPAGEAPKPPAPSKDKDNKASSNTSVTATARATGIDADGEGQLQTTTGSAEISDGALVISYGKVVGSLSGNDTVTNTGAIQALGTATAASRNASVVVSSGGSAEAVSKSTGSAYAAAIAAGAGDDSVTNSGILTTVADAEASALTLGLAVGSPQETTPPAGGDGDTPASPAAPAKLSTSTETGVEATARAYGIDTEGEALTTTTTGELSIGSGGLGLALGREQTGPTGNDTVTNDGIITATATASADSTDAAIQIDAAGSVNSESEATAKSASTGIYTGGGDDTVTNNVLLTASATATADALSLGLNVSKPPEQPAGDTPPPDPAPKKDKSNVKVNAGATAESTATGIDADGSLQDKSQSGTLAISGNGLDVQVLRSEASLSGADTVINRGAISADAEAVSGAVAGGVLINAAGSVDADATSKARATSSGILTGAGDDTVDNSFLLESNADATATALSVGITVSQPTDGTGSKPTTLDRLKDLFATTHSVANATAESRATGIDTEGETHAREQGLTIGNGGDGRLATYLDEVTSLAGNDGVVNSGAVIASAGAIAGAGAAEIRINTEGTASSAATAEAKATAGAVLTGGGDDTVVNSGVLASTATATAGALAVSFTQTDGPGAKARSDARATSDAVATGIGADGDIQYRRTEASLGLSDGGVVLSVTETGIASGGADEISNEGQVSAVATAISGAAGAAIAIDGSASSDVDAIARARATAIDGGGGADTINNFAGVDAAALSTSNALSVAFGQKGSEKSKSTEKVQASSTAGSVATGISGDSGTNTLRDAALTISASSEDGLSGVSASLLVQSDAAEGDDLILNEGSVSATAIAASGAEGASIAIDGVAKADTESTAKARATAIDGGGGADEITSLGELTATASATAGALAAGIGQKTSESSSARTRVEAGSIAEAAATGLSGDGTAGTGIQSLEIGIDADGFSLAYSLSSTVGAGDDTLDNQGAITSNATATSGTTAVAVTIKGAARAIADSKATADSAGLDSGGGADRVTNSGALTVDAAARAETLNAAISTEGRAISNSGLMDAGTVARSQAVGISTGGLTGDQSLAITGFIDFNDIGVEARYEKVKDGIGSDGNDAIVNSGDIVATSTADASRGNFGVTGKGAAVSISRVTAESYASGMDGGNLDDEIQNSGSLTATATTTAVLANVAVTGKGLAVAANAVWDGGTEARAVAAGINADSGERSTEVITAEADSGLARVRYNKDVQAASGDDKVFNSGEITTLALAVAPSLNVGVVTGTGLAVAVSTATAGAESTAIRGGDGDDELENEGRLSSTAEAIAAAANVAVTNQGVAIAADAVWDGGTRANATATGIAGDGGDRSRSTFLAVGTDQTTFESGGVLADGADTITNRGEIEARSTSAALSAGVAVAVSGVGVATATSTSTSRAAAIDAGAGESVDNVGNSGALTVVADAVAAAASVSVTNSGLAIAADSVWDGGTKADARARGIDVGAGGETVINDGVMDVTADATTLSAAVAVAISGIAGASATSTGLADAIAIDAREGNDADTVTNTGRLDVTANSLAASAAVTFTSSGVAIATDAVWDGGTGATSRARGIDVGDGADTVDNTGAITVTGDATAASLAAAVAVSGVAGAVATSTAGSDVAAIDTGSDAAVDTVINHGRLSANSVATANTAAVSFTMGGVAVAADAPWDGGTGADARAAGIATGGGADGILNTGDVTADAEAVTRSVTAGIAVSGVAGALATSTSTASATAIDGGEGADDDDVQNSGSLAAKAEARAAAVAVSFTAAGVAGAGGGNWDGGTLAESRARGIRVGDGDNDILNSGGVSAESIASSAGIALAVAVEGVAAAVTAATADAGAIGIDAGAGSDTITTRDAIAVSADATATTVSVAGTKFGVSGAGSWDGGASGIATATGISGGDGLNVIDNGGGITSTATALAPSTSVAFTVGGVAAAVSTASTRADAIAIDGGADRDEITNTGALVATAEGTAVAVNVALTGVGVGVASDSVWDGGTTSDIRSAGIRGGAGDDAIRNTTEAGTIDAVANSVATSASVAVTAGGIAGAISTSTAIAEAAAIDAGDGDDEVYNDSVISGRADARGTSVSVSVVGTGAAVASDSFWDGGTKANARAAGIAGGTGDDVVVNAGSTSAEAGAATTSVAVAASVSPSGGFAAAVAASTSRAIATALDGGAGADELGNEGALSARSTASAEGVSVAFTPIGAAVAGAFVDAATRAEAVATGMAGAEGADGLGNTESGSIVFDVSAATRDTAVALTLAGFSAADANAISDATGTGLDGGDDNDVLVNAGTLTGTVNSRAVARGLSIAGLGAGTAAAASTGLATGTGMAGGAGDDRVENSGTVDLTLRATAIGQALGGTLAGAALSDAGATANVGGTGQRGDDGSDTLVNSGTLRIDAGASTTARSVSAALLGAALASANSIAVSQGTGLSGGAGADTLINEVDGEVDVLATANVTATSVSVNVAGAADAEARTITSVGAVGLSGDEGDDAIDNLGLVLVRGVSRSTATGGSTSVSGAASARAGTEVETSVTGISGGAGADAIVNSGVIRIGPGPNDDPWMSRLVTGTGSVGFSGNMEAQSAAFARTLSTGISGGDDDDTLSNTGELAVAATARSDTGSGALSIFGSSSGGGESGAFTRATGLDGGAGNDYLETLGLLSVRAESQLWQTGTSFTFGGSGETGAALEARTDAIGVSGGDGADRIGAAGSISVTASSSLDSRGGGKTIFGTSAATGTSGAMTSALGLDGGAGDDVISSTADITLRATSTLLLDNASYTFGGAGATGGTLAAATTAAGILGGDGSDQISNGGAIDIEVLSELTSRGGSDTTFGGASASVTSGGRASAGGLAGGAGDDMIVNLADGSLSVEARTLVNANAVAYTFLGGGSQNSAALTGEARVTGMSGDDGNDRLENRGEVRVLADTTLTGNGGAKTSITGLATPVSTGVAEVIAEATGLSGGEGDDELLTNGLLQVTAVGVAESRNQASTNGFSIVNGNQAGAFTRSDISATGLAADEGSNRVDLRGDVIVNASSTAYALAVSSGAVISLGSDGRSVANSTAMARATGIAGGSGDDIADSNGYLSVTADAVTAKRLFVDLIIYRDIRSTDDGDEPPAPETVSADALPAFYDDQGDPAPETRDLYPDGTVVFWTASPPDQQEPNNALEVDGGHYIVRVETVDPDGPDGNQPAVEVWNWEFLAEGLIQPVVIQQEVAEFPSYAAANGSGLDGDGTANASGTAEAQATGIGLGDGNNDVEIAGELVVLARAEAAMHASADGDAFGDARGTATATATARATGIELGDGDDTVRSGGEIRVTAAPQAQALVNVTGGDVCIWFFGWWCGGGGDGVGTARSTLTAAATGIAAGDGRNEIVNDGTLTVIARPEIRVDPRSGEFVADVRQDNGETVSVSLSSRAVGIETGDGNDRVENNGSISVEAWDLLSACSSPGCRSLTVAKGVNPGTVSAAGILTGAGDDIVLNTGSLSVLVFRDGIASADLAIDTGAGDDELFLGDGSLIIGSVTLGEGDDRLVLSGTPAIVDASGAAINVDAGSGTDTLVLAGAGAYGGTPLSIERAAKTGPGTYQLPSLASLQGLGIDEGTLRLDSGYSFDPEGVFSTVIYADGRHGQLDLTGPASLEGALGVERRGTRFIADGTSYTVLQAGEGIDGDFAEVSLPESRPLLAFSLAQSSDSVRVVANAASFDTVTANPLYKIIAGNVFRSAPAGDSDFLGVLGILQTLEDGFDRAFGSLSPDAHMVTTGSAIAVTERMALLVQGHLGATRAMYRKAPEVRAVTGGVSFAFSSNGTGSFGMGSSRHPLMTSYLGDPGGMWQLAGNSTAAGGGLPAAQSPARSQAWLAGFSADGAYDAVGGYTAFDTDTNGFLAGYDLRIGENWIAGLGYARSDGDLKAPSLAASGGIDSWSGSVYATWFDGNRYLEGGLTYGEQSYDTSREVTVGEVERTATSAHDGDLWSAFLGGGIEYGFGTWSIEPYASLYYYRVEEDAFGETGADTLNQVVAARSTDALRGEAGGRISLLQRVGDSILDWHASLAVNHDFDIDDASISYGYAGAPGTQFTIDDRDLSQSSTVLGAGIAWRGPRALLSLDYRGQFNSDYDEQYFDARLAVRF